MSNGKYVRQFSVGPMPFSQMSLDTKMSFGQIVFEEKSLSRYDFMLAKCLKENYCQSNDCRPKVCWPNVFCQISVGQMSNRNYLTDNFLLTQSHSAKCRRPNVIRKCHSAKLFSRKRHGAVPRLRDKVTSVFKSRRQFNFWLWSLHYKTSYGRNLRIFGIS
jgi:hypothetical protein